MNPYKAFALCWLSTMAVIGLALIAGPLEKGFETAEKYAEVMRLDCNVGPSVPPKYLNDPERKPFSYRRTK